MVIIQQRERLSHKLGPVIVKHIFVPAHNSGAIELEMIGPRDASHNTRNHWAVRLQHTLDITKSTTSHSNNSCKMRPPAINYLFICLHYFSTGENAMCYISSSVMSSKTILCDLLHGQPEYVKNSVFTKQPVKIISLALDTTYKVATKQHKSAQQHPHMKCFFGAVGQLLFFISFQSLPSRSSNFFSKTLLLKFSRSNPTV